MAWSPMVSLELTDEEKLDRISPPAIENEPDYPWGARICLTHCELDKFGCDAGDFQVGDTIMIKALAKVTSVASNDSSMGPQDRVELQLCDMALMGEGDDDE